ncbi:MAG TPA: universal stress protein [Gemmatimonadales bacterium]|nr:universal stress protein [Gemmatimonadales bacterium]
MSWKPIIVGVDTSPASAQAASFAALLAERAGTACQLVHATPDAIGSLQAPDANRYRFALLEQARAQVVAALRDRVSAKLLDQLTVRLGATPVVLRQLVSTLGAELIVLGGKHHSALGRWFGGSTSLNTARTTDVPVLVTTGATAQIRRVLVAVDLSEAARATLVVAERYAAAFGAALRALSVLEPLPIIPEVAPPADAESYYAMAEELLQRDVWPLLRGAGVETVVRYGMAVETILREAVDWSADLLVVGSHGKGWAERLLVGSVTERLLNALPTALLVVPVRVAQRVEEAERARAPEWSPMVALA